MHSEISQNSQALRKSLGSKSLTRCELGTVLHKIEGCVHSRPLTFVGDGVEDREVLTHAHFLIGMSTDMQIHELSESQPILQEICY